MMTRRSWAVSGATSLLIHLAVATAALLLRFPFPPRSPAIAELQIVSAEPAPPRAGGQPGRQPAPGATSVARVHHVRPPEPAPTPTPAPTPAPTPEEPAEDPEDIALPAPPGDDDSDDGDEQDAGGGAGGLAGSGAGTGTARPNEAGPASLASDSREAVSALDAAYLRIYQVLPPVPREVWSSGRRLSITALICVSAEGQVADVTIQQASVPQLEAPTLAALRTWRYRPRIVAGKPRAFCHPMKLIFDPD